MKRTASAKGNSKSRGSSIKRSPHQLRITSPDVRFAVCVKSGGYVDLEPLKVYRVRHDAAANAECMLRVVEASGEDYLYPASYFRPIQAPRRLFEIVEESA